MKTQRDRFESWAVAPPREWPVEKQPNSPSSAWPGQYVAHYVQCAWEAWQAACPEGWQAVPTHTPTIDMTEAGSCHVMRGQDYERAQACWNAMREAAPKPEDVCKSPG